MPRQWLLRRLEKRVYSMELHTVELLPVQRGTSLHCPVPHSHWNQHVTRWCHTLCHNVLVVNTLPVPGSALDCYWNRHNQFQQLLITSMSMQRDILKVGICWLKCLMLRFSIKPIAHKHCDVACRVWPHRQATSLHMFTCSINLATFFPTQH